MRTSRAESLFLRNPPAPLFGNLLATFCADCKKTCESWNGKRVQIGESNCTVFGFLVVLVRRAFRFLVALLVLLALAC